MKRQTVRKIIIYTSLILFPLIFYYFSPELIIMAAQQGIVNGSFIVFIAMFLVAIFLGRLWCGWLCPVGGMQEACFKFQKKRVPPKADKYKYIIWLIWLMVITAMVVRAGGYKKIDFLFMTTNGLSMASWQDLVRALVVLAVILFIALPIGRRGFCHGACWMAPFMVLGRKLSIKLGNPRLQLVSESSKCISCLTCTKNCPQSLEVNEMVRLGKMDNPECILCGTCADGCLQKVIRYSFSK